MSLFTRSGMLKIPNPKDNKVLCENRDLYVINECYCPNGHSLISDEVLFNNFKGILVKVSRSPESGTLALSPTFGCKNKITKGIELKFNELYNLECPVCNASLPVFNRCHCGGSILSLFMNKKGAFSSFVGICNRIGCKESSIRIDDDLLHESMIGVL